MVHENQNIWAHAPVIIAGRVKVPHNQLSANQHLSSFEPPLRMYHHLLRHHPNQFLKFHHLLGNGLQVWIINTCNVLFLPSSTSEGSLMVQLWTYQPQYIFSFTLIHNLTITFTHIYIYINIHTYIHMYELTCTKILV